VLNIVAKFSRGEPHLVGALNTSEICKISHFQPICGHISETNRTRTKLLNTVL